MGSPLSPRASHNTKLRNRLKLEKRDLSYADLHSEVMKNVENIQPASSGLQQKQRVGSKAIESEELVKYMSKLPSYLERGENVQDKTLNVGVLNWRSLEKWQNNYRQILNGSSRCSPSSSSTSSFFSTDESSNPSRRGHNCSPARQRMRRHTLQCYLNASPKEGYPQCVKSSVGNVGKYQDLKAVPSNPLKEQQNIHRTFQAFNKDPSEIKLRECKRRDSDPQSIPKKKTSLDFAGRGAPSSSKGKMKVQDSEAMKEVEKLPHPYCNSIDSGPEGHKTVVLLLARDGPVYSHSAIIPPFDSSELSGQKSMESRRRSFSEGSHFKNVYPTEIHSDIPRSCPVPCEVDAESVKFSSDQSHPSSSSAKISISPFRSKILEEQNSTRMPINSTAIQSSKGSDPTTSAVAATKVRNPSPTCRFSIDMGRIGRSSSSKDSASATQLISKHAIAESGAERAEVSACSDISTSNKPNATSRAHSSPLRRLLDPLLKLKAANSHQFAEQAQKDSASIERARKSSDGRGESPTVPSVKVKLDLTRSKTINIDHPHNNEKHGSSTIQALLQIAIKNGLPLFTFAVDNSNDVMVATKRRLSSSRKDDDSWIYTFFTICETKKKNGNWLNQGGKGKANGYVPNVVAQMNVSEPPFTNLSRHHSMDQFSIKEFVLFTVGLRQLDQQTSDLQPNDELAAIVVELPRMTIRGLNQDGQQSNNLNDLSAIGLKELLPDVTGYSNLRDSEENGSRDLFSTTVILPGGVHGLPSKGEPSPLIERWKSGGLCDCGGWDLGCRTQVLANQTRPSMRTSSIKSHLSAGQFDLFSQGEVLDNRPVFSLSPYKNGIFSVEFNSSLSLLQAFSISIAVLDSRRPSELSKLSNLFEDKLYEETTLLENDG